MRLNFLSVGQGEIIEAHMPAQQFHDFAFQPNETLVLTPRKARVFVE